MKYFSSKGISIIICFLASSLLHEYVLLLISYTINLQNNSNVNNKYYPYHGNQTLFFLWNGVLILLEGAISHWNIFQWMKKVLPSYVITMLVLMLSLPVSHLFTNEYVQSGFYTHFKVGFPIFVLIE